VDFVGSSATGSVSWGASKGALTKTQATTSFLFSTIGHLHQAKMVFDSTPGAAGFYQVNTSDGAASEVFAVTPVVARPEVFAVFGDFGYANDVCMDSLIKDAQDGVYDAVLHVGDWAASTRN
jgi:hypothetical protein